MLIERLILYIVLVLEVTNSLVVPRHKGDFAHIKLMMMIARVCIARIDTLHALSLASAKLYNSIFLKSIYTMMLRAIRSSIAAVLFEAITV